MSIKFGASQLCTNSVGIWTVRYINEKSLKGAVAGWKTIKENINTVNSKEKRSTQANANTQFKPGAESSKPSHLFVSQQTVSNSPVLR